MDPWSVWFDDAHIQVKGFQEDPDQPGTVKALDHKLTLDEARELHRGLDAAIREAEAAAG
jgi:hypothetical protein